jgi:hypothetical protein
MSSGLGSNSQALVTGWIRGDVAVRSAERCSVFHRLEEARDVELEWLDLIDRTPDQPIVDECGTLVVWPPDFESFRVVVDGPVCGNIVALKGTTLRDSIVPRRTGR